MIDLGYDNLFTSEFDMGCDLPNSKELEYIETLYKWLDFKKKDFWMERHRPEHTLFIAFLHIIDLETFKEILHDLILIYKKSYPFGEKSDFIEHNFRYTLRFLEKFININYFDFSYYNRPHGIRNDIYFYFNHLAIYEIEDYILEQSKDIKWYQQYYKKVLELINNVDFGINISETDLIPHPQTETKLEKETINTKPTLKTEVLQMVFEIIKDFFNIEQQSELLQILKTGNIAKEKLIFKDNGNRLTDTFKKLKEHDFITGCQKQDLINWIISNFNFIQQKKSKAFVYDTVEKIISRNDFPCKKPLIEIKNGKIEKVVIPLIKKYRK